MCIPVKDMSLSLVARECTFATKELSDVLPNDKIFLCYYHHAIAMCQFRGKGNHVELPEYAK